MPEVNRGNFLQAFFRLSPIDCPVKPDNDKRPAIQTMTSALSFPGSTGESLLIYPLEISILIPVRPTKAPCFASLESG